MDQDRPPPDDRSAPPSDAVVDLREVPSSSASSSASRARGGVEARVPPHSLEAEVSVLGAAMLSPVAASEAVELLSEDDFYRSAHATVFEAIRDLVRVGESPDVVTVMSWIQARERLDEVGGPAAIADLTTAVPTAANAVHYAKIVAEKALLRRLIDAGTAVTRLGFEEQSDARAAVDRAEQEIFAVADRGTRADYSALRDLLNDSFARLEKLAADSSEVTGLSTGFNDLDRLTAGLQPENLIILAARPAMGKSSFALNLAQYVTVQLQKPVALFSLEMSKIEIVNRMLSSEAGVDSGKLKTGRLDEADWRRLADSLGRLAEAPMFIDDTASITMLEIASKCRRIKQKHGLSLVVVDYLQLMQSHRRVDNRQQEVSEISRALKMLAKDLGVPVVALSQLSRQPESRVDKRPMLADLRESGSIEQDADIVGFIYRDEVYDEDTPDRGIAELIIAKHRNGATRTVRLAFLNHLTKFANLASAPARESAGGGPPAQPYGDRAPAGPPPSPL